MSHPVANSFTGAAALVVEDACRKGNCLHFQAGQEVFYVGDIHGHRRNLAKVIAAADLGAHPDRRLVLQEILHGGPPDDAGGDRSFEPLMRAVRLKLAHPDQVFFLIGNHDLAQIDAQEIVKAGRGMCKAFNLGLARAFGDHADEVRSAIYQFLRALPLAARCPNGVFMSHSLPSPNRMHLIDWDILERPYRDEDLHRGGSLYEWIWGRAHTPAQLALLARRFDATQFLLGHQPIEDGAEIRHGRLVILAGYHARGAVMVFDAGQAIDDAELADHVRPIVTL